MTPTHTQREMAESAGALYFPYIRVPESAWFTNVLLYWPRVGSIVPTTFLEEPESLGPHMQGLVHEGLVHQVYPDVSDVPGFARSFIQYLDDGEAAVGERGGTWFSMPIHLEKLGWELAEELVRRGLARRTGSRWLDVESSVAERFMTYLAVVLCQRDAGNLSPVTDDPRCGRLWETGRPADRDVLREQVLTNLLPALAQSVPPPLLADFKQRHGAMLQAFRVRVESALAEAVALDEVAARESQVQAFIRSAQDEVREIDAALRGFQWSGAVTWTAAGLAATAADLEAGMSYAGIHTLVGAIAAVTGRWRRRRGALERPMAYTVLAQRLFSGG